MYFLSASRATNWIFSPLRLQNSLRSSWSCVSMVTTRVIFSFFMVLFAGVDFVGGSQAGGPLRFGE